MHNVTCVSFQPISSRHLRTPPEHLLKRKVAEEDLAWKYLRLRTNIRLWKSQKRVTLSSTKAEYLSLADECYTIKWPSQILNELGTPHRQTGILWDTAGEMDWANSGNPK